MKGRFWIDVGIVGIILIGVVAFLLTYRGQVSAWVLEQITKQQLPEARTYIEIKKPDRIGEVDMETREKDNTSILPSMEVLSENDEGEKGVKLPEEFNLDVSFMSQAPFEVWDDLHKEACEEAAVIIVDAFYKGRNFTKQSAEDEIQDLVKWEIEKFGYYKDTTAQETVRILREYFGYENARVVQNPTIEKIKREVYNGNPVILPAAGRLLGNRYFRTPGPIYHMLVVRGWAKNGMIIANDPGTKRGEGYLYEPEVLMNAIHDWDADNIEKEKKVMIVVKN